MSVNYLRIVVLGAISRGVVTRSDTQTLASRAAGAKRVTAVLNVRTPNPIRSATGDSASGSRSKPAGKSWTFAGFDLAAHDLKRIFIRRHVTCVGVTVTDGVPHSPSWVAVVTRINPLAPVFVSFVSILQDGGCYARRRVAERFRDDMGAESRITAQIFVSVSAWVVIGFGRFVTHGAFKRDRNQLLPRELRASRACSSSSVVPNSCEKDA